ncbi:hypothetical protein DY000_02058410 [Brassica cretica]|uniref:Uncharacterized protein n=1 Tax=Brassica cretica TaxID=69181 RepID=A0ABQ7AF25_BRACR|nr:hypothetical protein DY000_02058410 [Brassica cretica]
MVRHPKRKLTYYLKIWYPDDLKNCDYQRDSLYSYECAVPSKCKDYGEESHGWSYLCKHSGRNTQAAAFRPRTMMHVVKILRLLAAVSTFKIALFFCCSYSASSYMVVSTNGWNQDNAVSYLFSRSNCLAA